MDAGPVTEKTMFLMSNWIDPRNGRACSGRDVDVILSVHYLQLWLAFFVVIF
jgi:hypothetical protein